jgi:alcohol dehydrogenase class IV
MTVQRLLKNNPRPMTQADAEAIYAECLRQARLCL